MAKLSTEEFERLFAHNKGEPIDFNSQKHKDLLEYVLERIDSTLIEEYRKDSEVYIKHRCNRCGMERHSLWYALTKGAGCKCNRYKTETKIRQYMQEMMGTTFHRCRPEFLKDAEYPLGLELDGYNEELKLAFEYDGIQHFNKAHEWYRDIIPIHDARKELRCKEEGVTLIRFAYYEMDKTPELKILQTIRDRLLSVGFTPVNTDFSSFSAKPIKEFYDYEDARQQCISHDILSREQYRIEYRKIGKMPSDPAVMYKHKGWKSWEQFLGKPQTKFPIEYYVAMAEELAENNSGELPSAGWLQLNGYVALDARMQDNPECFKHIFQRRLRFRSRRNDWRLKNEQ